MGVWDSWSHRIRSLGRYVALTGTLALVAGCGTSAAQATAPSVLTIALPVQLSLDWWPPIVPGLDCYTLTGGYLGPDMYRPLLWMSKTDTIQYSRSIASGIAVSGHDTVFTITLNPKWHWSNGQPITSADVVYDAQLILAASGPKSPLAYCFAGSGGVPQDWKSVTADGPDKVVVTTTASVNPVWFEHNGLSQLVPMPKATWDKYANPLRELAWINAIGNSPGNAVYKVVDGPYTITKAVQDQYWEFSINPRFSGSHKPTIPHVLYDYEASAASTFADLKKGNVQIAHIPLNYYQPSEALSDYRIVKEPLFAYAYDRINFNPKALNGEGALLDKLYIRQALQYGIDQQGILKSILLGFGNITNGPVPYAPHNAYYDYNMPQYYQFNIARGRAVLEAHGWRLVNGVMQRNGQPLTFQVIFGTGSPSLTDELELMQADWAKEGIRVSLKSEAPSAVRGIVDNPANSTQWAISAGGGWIYAPDFYPSGGGLYKAGAGFNFGDYNDPHANALIDATYAGGTPAQVTARFQAYQTYMAQQLPDLWVPTSDYIWAVSKNVHGFAANFSAFWSYTPDNFLTYSR